MVIICKTITFLHHRALEIETQTTCRVAPCTYPAKDVHGYPEITSETYNTALWFSWNAETYLTYMIDGFDYE